MFGQEEEKWITSRFPHKTQRMLSDKLKNWSNPNYDAFMGFMCFLFCLKADSLEVTKYRTIWLQQTQANILRFFLFWRSNMKQSGTFYQIICWWKSIQKAKGIGRGAQHNAQHESRSTVIMPWWTAPRKPHLWHWSLHSLLEKKLK